LNIKKCIFNAPFGIFLGHVVCKQGLLVDPAKIVVIVNLPPPKSVHQLRATLGHTGYYRKFIKGICTDYCTHGEIVKEGYQVSME
jgi:hypothetical protein